VTAGLHAVNVANKILNVYRNTAFAAIATVYVQLHTGDPGAAGTTAVSVGDATRKQASWNAAAGGSMALSSSPANWTNGGTSETINYISLWDQSSSGNFLQSASVGSPQAWASTNTLTITTLTLSYTPIAA